MATIIIKQNEEIDLSQIFGFDEDFNGNNGEEFTSQEAIDNGFESDLEYHTYEAEELYPNDIEKMINHVLEEFLEINENYYDIEMDICDNGSETIICYHIEHL